ncbi:unnamed protein product, partial [Brenthis ino]
MQLSSQADASPFTRHARSCVTQSLVTELEFTHFETQVYEEVCKANSTKVSFHSTIRLHVFYLNIFRRQYLPLDMQPNVPLGVSNQQA